MTAPLPALPAVLAGPRVDLTPEWPVRLGTRVTPENVDEVAATIVARLAGVRLPVFYLGRQSYRPIWALQKRLHAWRVAGAIGDVALLLEHEPVYTLGKNANADHLLAGRPADAEVVATDRGGDVTFHGPGQLVGYPIVDLREHRPSVTWYLRGLEGVIIAALSEFGLPGAREVGLTGVWLRGGKVAALGVRLAHWTATHGFAMNVHVARHYLRGLIPCGLLEYGVANMSDYLSTPVDVWTVARSVTPLLQEFLRGRHGEVPGAHQSPAA